MATSKELFVIRDSRVEDESFIYSTWLLGLYYGNDSIKADVPDEAFMKSYRPIIRLILGKPGVKARVVCLEEDPDTILGYAVYEGETLHWVFMRPAWRRYGLAKRLIPSTIENYSHVTRMADRIKPAHWKYQPL